MGRQDLTNPTRITQQSLRNSRLDVVNKFQPFLLRAKAERHHGFTQTLAKIERNRLQFHFPGFNLGEVQNVIDD
jgi:hypothetical protein